MQYELGFATTNPHLERVSYVGQIECKEGVVKRAVVGGGERARRWLGPG